MCSSCRCSSANCWKIAALLLLPAFFFYLCLREVIPLLSLVYFGYSQSFSLVFFLLQDDGQWCLRIWWCRPFSAIQDWRQGLAAVWIKSISSSKKHHIRIGFFFLLFHGCVRLMRGRIRLLHLKCYHLYGRGTWDSQDFFWMTSRQYFVLRNEGHGEYVLRPPTLLTCGSGYR